MPSLAKRSTDVLVEQLLASLAIPARVAGPGASLTVMDTAFVGTLKTLLREAYPGVPDEMWLALRDDLIVVAQAEEAPGNVVHYAPSVLRVRRAGGREGERVGWMERTVYAWWAIDLVGVGLVGVGGWAARS